MFWWICINWMSVKAVPSISCLAALSCVAILQAQPAPYTFDQGQQFLKTYCQTCHQGNSPAGGFAVQRLATADTITSQAERWNKVAFRLRNGEMSPKGVLAPLVPEREQFLAWA